MLLEQGTSIGLSAAAVMFPSHSSEERSSLRDSAALNFGEDINPKNSANGTPSK